MAPLTKKYTWLVRGQLFLVALCLSFGQANAQKKNILFIAVDDLKPAIGAYGDEMAKTPNIDKLANKGTLFLNAYCQQAVCGPSRASLLTGLRPDHTEVWDLKTQIRDKNPNVVTLPQLLKQNGYETHAIGKIFDPRSVDKGHDKRSWTVPYVTPTNLPGAGPEPQLGSYQSTENSVQIKFYEDLATANGLSGNKKNEFIRKNFKPSTESAPVGDEAYTDGRIARSALEKLDEFTNSEKPFLLMVGFKKPHLPFVAPKKYWDLFDRKDFSTAKFQKHAKGSTPLAYHGLGELGSYTDVVETLEPNGDVSKPKQLELIHGYYASVAYIDAQIGKLLTRLEESGQAENTIIVLWGDHGFHLGDHGLWCKHTNFEQATHAPLIILDPSADHGTVSTPVELLDIYPTLCELTGVKPKSKLDGQNLNPAIKAGELDKKYAVSQWPSRQQDGMGYSIRTDRYRYTEWYKVYKSTAKRNPKDLLAVELYDYQEDYNETKNLAKDKDYTAVVAELEAQLHTFLDSFAVDERRTGEVEIIDNLPPIRELADKLDPPLYFGAALPLNYLGTENAELFAREFNYLTPENEVKQSAVHPSPDIWDWSKIDRILDFAKKHEITVRLHGPISPQASRWARDDARKPEELLQNMTEYMTAQCKRYNGHPNIRWMDVVNETVDRDGSWFGPKPGNDKWENPWPIIGKNDDGSDVPLYITKAFEIANEYAPDIKLVYNQHGAMEPVMWERVKKTILYLREKGLRVDGLGWQAHIKSTETLPFNEEELQYFSELIDWAHTNNLEFHITEFDYKLMDEYNAKTKRQQALAYTNILKVLLSKRTTGVVTYGTWGLKDGVGQYKAAHQFLFEEDLGVKPVYLAIKELLNNPENLEPVFNTAPVNLVANPDFEEQKTNWLMFGGAKLVGDNTKSGNYAVSLQGSKTGLKQTISINQTGSYELSGWFKVAEKDKVIVKVTGTSGDEPRAVVKGKGNYKNISIIFEAQAGSEIALIVQKWEADDPEAVAYVDNVSLYEN